jgi:hypothetical protein
MWLVLVLLITYSYAFIMATTTDSNDQSECDSAIIAVTAKHRLTESVSVPGHTAMFCELGVHFPLLRTYETIDFYGVLQSSEQDAILADLRVEHDKNRHHRMLVRFIEKENWRAWSDPAAGRSGGSRGPETPTRQVWIE